MSISFIEALQNHDYEAVLLAEKSDIHSHAGRGVHPLWLQEKLRVSNPEITIQAPPSKFDSLNHMQEWFEINVKPYCREKEGNILRWEGCFAEARRNHIKRLAISFGTADVDLVGGMENFQAILEGFHQQYCKDTLFEPELAYSTYCNVEEESEKIDEYLAPRFFRSIDLNCGENVQPFHAYVSLYRKAEKYGIKKKAHVGETGSANDILEAIEVLGLDEVHHGIAAASSLSTMRVLADRKIQLNVCPSSNFMLQVAESYKHHQIQTLVRNGVPVTINTDDLLIFQQSIDQEYIHLYEAGTLTAEELEEIRIQGLRS